MDPNDASLSTQKLIQQAKKAMELLQSINPKLSNDFSKLEESLSQNPAAQRYPLSNIVPSVKLSENNQMDTPLSLHVMNVRTADS